MIQTRALESIEQLSELKQQYIDQVTAPLDGMWLCGFVPMATHFGFYEGGELVGYCCVNDDGYLLQFYLCPSHQNQASNLFDSILKSKNPHIEKINGAFVSTAEPQYLSLCLDSFRVFKVNALMYQLSDNSKPVSKSHLALEVVKSEQLTDAVKFAHSAIGAPEEWLTGYFTNLINRQELFFCLGFCSRVVWWYLSRWLRIGYGTSHSVGGNDCSLPLFCRSALSHCCEARGKQELLGHNGFPCRAACSPLCVFC